MPELTLTPPRGPDRSPDPSPATPCAWRPVLLAATYNNAKTLPILLDALETTPGVTDVLVVNDGSTDATADLLARWSRGGNGGRLVHTHPVNRGKAAALRTGFARLAALGYTHALTIDTDGQHDPADVPALLDAARLHPRAFVLGVRGSRDVAGYPPKNRLGRWASNTLVFWESGLRVGDSQCGLRVYPLRVVTRLPAASGRYGYETEILTRCGWAQVPVVERPVGVMYDVPTGRVSHFRPWRDSLAATAMHARLLLRSCWPIRPTRLARPGPGRTGTIVQRAARYFSPARAWRAIRDNAVERRRFAAGLSTGVFVGNLPIYGLQTLLCLIVARKMRLHPLAVIAGSHVSTPPVGPVLIAAAVMVGHVVLHGRVAGWDDFDPQRLGYLNLLRRVALEWVVGSLLCGAALAALTYLLTAALLRLLPPPNKIVPADAPPPPHA